jgi:hypothetical protein
MLRFFAKSAIFLLAVGALEGRFCTMFEEEFTARCRAVDDLLICIELLLYAEFLML